MQKKTHEVSTQGPLTLNNIILGPVKGESLYIIVWVDYDRDSQPFLHFD